MPDKKLTDSKVIKGLKCCIERPCDRNCPYIRRIRCNDALMQDALALINRLQAENEQLAKDKENLAYSLANAVGQKMTAKAEAYKECIEKVKEKSQVEIYCDNQLPEPITTYHIKESVFNNLLKELIGEQKNGTGKK